MAKIYLISSYLLKSPRVLSEEGQVRATRKIAMVRRFLKREASRSYVKQGPSVRRQNGTITKSSYNTITNFMDLGSLTKDGKTLGLFFMV
jgi:hypothetical protein